MRAQLQLRESKSRDTGARSPEATRSLLNVSLRSRFESLRFDDDQNLLLRGRFFTVDLTLDRPLARSFGAFVAVENLPDRRYPVQATPLELQGTPLTVTAGLRLDLRPR